MKIAQKQDYSQLFGGLPANQNQNNIFNSINLSDYKTVKNGSYGKLLKAYYKPESTSDKSGKTVSSAAQKINDDKKNASNVKNAVNDLSNSFDKIAKDLPKEEDVKNFIDTYNKAVLTGKDSTNGSIRAMTSGMTSLVSRNSEEVNKMGAILNKDGTLKFDVDKFKKESTGEEKNTMNTSFVDDMKKYIKKIEEKAEAEINNLSTYNKNASYINPLNSGLAFDSGF